MGKSLTFKSLVNVIKKIIKKNNNNSDTLYLASQSQSRQKLLKETKISFKIIKHKSDENILQGDLTFSQYVIKIANHKMSHVILPDAQKYFRDTKKNYIYVCTADTLVKNIKTNKILGKPKDKQEAKKILKCVSSGPVEVMTGCCVKKFILSLKCKSTGRRPVDLHTSVSCKDDLDNKVWVCSQTISWATGAIAQFSVPQNFLKEYFEFTPGALYASGASVIEGYAQKFLKYINGSYSAVIGLPVWELVKNLEKIGFKF